jgi:hypothetical protein
MHRGDVSDVALHLLFRCFCEKVVFQRVLFMVASMESPLHVARC